MVGLDHPGVDGGHHQLTGVLSHDVPHGARGPGHEFATSSRRPVRWAPWGRLSQSGTAKVSTISDHSMPSASPGWSSHRSQRSRTGPSAVGPGPDHRAGDGWPSRWPGAAPRSTGRSPGAAHRSRRAGRPAPPPADRPRGGQPRAPLRSPDDPVQVALRLAVAHQHNPGRALFGGKIRSTPASAPLVAVRLAHARFPTKCSSWRSVRHSTTSSQWAAYSPTMESPDPQ